MFVVLFCKRGGGGCAPLGNSWAAQGLCAENCPNGIFIMKIEISSFATPFELFLRRAKDQFAKTNLKPRSG